MAAIMPRMAITVRPARPGDPAAALLHASAASYYDAFAGSTARAASLLAYMYPHAGHSAGYDVCVIAERDGEPAAVLAAFAAEDAGRYARRFVSLAMRRLPPGAWPSAIRHLRAASRVGPSPPAGSWYVDGLAVAAAHRRQGIAQVLLEAAADDARRAGARLLALDTGLENQAAQALYAKAGFSVRGETRAADAETAAALGGTGFVSYAKVV
jgi:ribosomal protein S18 acetylase RimI-like enzyme